MSFLHHKKQVFLLIVLSVVLLTSVSAFADSVRFYDNGVITGFESEVYDKTIETEYKYAMVVLNREFPSQLTVRLGGEAVYQENIDGSHTLASVRAYETRMMDVIWKCREKYDDDLDVYHFVPNFGEYELAEGVELPEITVSVLGKRPVPPLHPIPENSLPSVPVLEEKGLAEKTSLPSSYNGYEMGVLPPVRDQEGYGICWTFSSIACVEADLIHDGNANTDIDFSELHLAYFTLHGFYDEKGLNTGDTVSLNGADYLQTPANALYASFTMTNMLGPVNESTVPYSLAPEYSPEPIQGRTGDYLISGVYEYDLENDWNSVKTAIMDHGAVSVVMFIDENFWSPENNSYYYPSYNGTNHVVTLVGWDDGFSRDNFKNGIPEGDGAWLVRNSWGVDDYSYYGYFWLSYYNQSMWDTAIAFDAETSRYEHVYAYDNSNSDVFWPASEGADHITISQDFYVDSGEEIKAVGFYSLGANLGLDFTITAGNSVTTQSYTTTAAGYYLIPLSNPLYIQNSSDVIVEVTVTGGTNKGLSTEYSELDYHTDDDGHTIWFYAETGSSGAVINGYNTQYDGKIKLFTNDKNTPSISPLTIDANKVLGYSSGISLTMERDDNIDGYGIAVYDVADNNKNITPAIDAPVNSGNTTTIKIHGSSLVNGKVYKLSVYKYKISGSETVKSNTVSVYGVPNTEVKQTTAQPINNGVKVNSKHIAGTSGIRYYVYNASTGKQVKKVTLEGENQASTISSLENGQLYYVYSRPYTMYEDKYCWGPQSNKVYFVPVASPSGSSVLFTDPTTAVVSTSANSTADGIRVLYRTVGGALKNGCEAAANSCSITNLSNKTAYEFYLMRYSTVNGVKHYGAGITFLYSPLVLSAMSAPADAIVSYSGDTFTIKITKSGEADGISVLYRANEGNFEPGCENASNNCSFDLDRNNSYTFYVMQYKTVDGKNTYSKGIVVKNVYGTKDAAGPDIYSAVDEEIGEEMISDALSALDKSTQEEIKMLLGDEASYDPAEDTETEPETYDVYMFTDMDDETELPVYEEDDNTLYDNSNFVFMSIDGSYPVFQENSGAYSDDINGKDFSLSLIYQEPDMEPFAPSFRGK